MNAPVRPAEPLAVPPANVGTWNIANIITLIRMLMVPVFAVLLLQDGGHATSWRYAATAVFALASATDRLDGELARRRHLVTDFGKIADPIADKALMGTALVGLSALHELPWWVTIVVLARELGITMLRFVVIRFGVIAASRGGKVKTLLQGIAIGGYLLPIGWLATPREVVMGAAVALTVITGADYVARAIRLRRSGPAPSTGTTGPGGSVSPGGSGGSPLTAAGRDGSSGQQS
jgi:CDP-diacylglycerol---glycerol-3-phosphate 3-phosphatidyltransferase